jgi:hypothetical protein
VTDDAAPPEASASRPPPVIRTGCIVLAALGALSFVFAGTSLLDPPAVRCSIAKALIESANEDKKDFNNVDIGDRQPDDLKCDEAIALATQIPKDREGKKRTSLPSESAIRTRASLAATVGLGQAVSGMLTLRTLDRRARTAALAFAAFGILFAALGILSAAALVFVVYALAFSTASRSIWPTGRAQPPPDPTD